MFIPFRLSGISNKKTIHRLLSALEDIPSGTTLLDLSDNDLSGYSDAMLAVFFYALPDGLTSLVLSGDCLKNKSEASKAYILANIHHSITTVKLGEDNFYRKHEGALIEEEELTEEYFSEEDFSEEAEALEEELSEEDSVESDLDPIQWTEEHSAGLTEFSLKKQGLGFVEGTELPKLMKAISTDVKQLDLSHNDLDEQTNEVLAAMFAVTPVGVTFIDLSHNHLESKTQQEKDFIFANMPKTVMTIKLGDADYYRATPSQLRQTAMDTHAGLSDEDAVLWLKEKSAGLTSFNLSSQGLGGTTGQQLAMGLGAISSEVKILNLRDNNLTEHTDEDLSVAFANLPAGLVRLDLSGNGFDRKTKAEQDIIFSKLSNRRLIVLLDNGNYYSTMKPKDHSVKDQAFVDSLLSASKESIQLLAEHSASQTSFDLSVQCLGLLHGFEVAEYIAAISDSVTSLDLSFNDFSRLVDNDLAIAFAPLQGKNVTSLDLSGNGFTSEQQDKVLRMLPPSIQVNFNFVPMSDEEVDALVARVLSGLDSDLSVDVSPIVDESSDSEVFMHEYEDSAAGRSISPGINSDRSCELGDDEISIDESFADILESVRESTSSVDLSCKDLGDMSDSEQEELLSSINDSVRSVDLSANGLYKKNSATVAASLQHIKPHLELLNFSDNNLGVSGINLALILKAASEKADCLILINNKLDKRDSVKLSDDLAALSENLRYLDLSDNGLELKSESEKALIFSKVPQTVTVIKLGKGNFYRGTEADLVGLPTLPDEEFDDADVTSTIGPMFDTTFVGAADDISFVRAADDTSFIGSLDGSSFVRGESVDWSDEVLEEVATYKREQAQHDSTLLTNATPVIISGGAESQGKSRQSSTSKRVHDLSDREPGHLSETAPIARSVSGFLGDDDFMDRLDSDDLASQSREQGNGDSLAGDEHLDDVSDDSLQQQDIDSTNYSFCFKCLIAVAAVVSVIALVAATLFFPPAVPLAVVSVVGIGFGYGAYGFFSNSSSTREEPAVAPNLDSPAVK